MSSQFENSKKYKIFICHHNEDAPVLSILKKILKPAGFECFLAHDDIVVGENFVDSIKREILDCDIFLYFGSEGAQSSQFCQQEIGMAVICDKKIIPVMIGNNPLPDIISHTQAINLRGNELNHVDLKWITCIEDHLLKLIDNKSEDVKSTLTNEQYVEIMKSPSLSKQRKKSMMPQSEFTKQRSIHDNESAFPSKNLEKDRRNRLQSHHLSQHDPSEKKIDIIDITEMQSEADRSKERLDENCFGYRRHLRRWEI